MLSVNTKAKHKPALPTKWRLSWLKILVGNSAKPNQMALLEMQREAWAQSAI